MPIKKDLNTWPIESSPWNRVHIDYAGPLKGKMYLMVVDAYSKWPEIFEMSSCTSVTTIRKLRSLFTQFGNLQILVSDNGTCFSSTEFKDFCDAIGIKHVHAPPFHPQSNGQVERFVDTFKRAFKKLEGEGVGTQEVIETFLQTYRRSPCSATSGEQSPAQLFLGRPIQTTLTLVNITNPHTSTQRNKNMEKQFNKLHGAKKKDFEIESKVWSRNFRSDRAKWISARITKRIGKAMYELLTQDGLICTRHANQLRPRQCDITPPESPEVIDLPFQDEVQPPRKERIIPVLATPPMKTTSPSTERRKSPPCRATRLRRAPTRLNVEPFRKTYDP